MIGSITEVWTSVLTVLTEMLGDVQAIFYTAGTGGEGDLTFLGVLAVISVAIEFASW